MSFSFRRRKARIRPRQRSIDVMPPGQFQVRATKGIERDRHDAEPVRQARMQAAPR
jgi:hypothetical protein